jgi:hypothetical protein
MTSHSEIVTCGMCAHFDHTHGIRGRCTCEVPVWVYVSLNNISGTTACGRDDVQAAQCDKFVRRGGESDI